MQRTYTQTLIQTKNLRLCLIKHEKIVKRNGGCRIGANYIILFMHSEMHILYYCNKSAESNCYAASFNDAFSLIFRNFKSEYALNSIAKNARSM